MGNDCAVLFKCYLTATRGRPAAISHGAPPLFRSGEEEEEDDLQNAISKCDDYLADDSTRWPPFPSASL